MTTFSSDFLTEKEFNQELNYSNLNGNVYVPLSRVNLNRFPIGITLTYGGKEYKELSSIVDEIYKSRKYSISESEARKRIANLLIKALIEKKRIYGKEISYRFDFIDASNFNIEI